MPPTQEYIIWQSVFMLFFLLCFFCLFFIIFFTAHKTYTHTNGTFYVEIKINMYKKRENKVLSKILYWDPNGSHLCAFYIAIDSYFVSVLIFIYFFLLYVHFWYKQFCVLPNNKTRKTHTIIIYIFHNVTHKQIFMNLFSNTLHKIVIHINFRWLLKKVC